MLRCRENILTVDVLEVIMDRRAVARRSNIEAQHLSQLWPRRRVKLGDDAVLYCNRDDQTE
jgi:hypothetical protein